MLATRPFLRNLALTAVLGSLMVAPAVSSEPGTVSVVTPTPPPTITNEPPQSCHAQFASIMVLEQEAVGELGTAMRSASITYSIVPSVPCSVLAVLPSSLQDDFAEFETRWYNWWQPQRCVPVSILPGPPPPGGGFLLALPAIAASVLRLRTVLHRRILLTQAM